MDESIRIRVFPLEHEIKRVHGVPAIAGPRRLPRRLHLWFRRL